MGASLRLPRVMASAGPQPGSAVSAVPDSGHGAGSPSQASLRPSQNPHSPQQSAAQAPAAQENIGLEKTMASATSLPPIDLDPDTGPIPALPKVSDSLKRFNETPPEIVDALRRSRPPPLVDDELPRGASIGRYIVVSCIGSGGMGVVYAAYDPELDRKVATKLLRATAGGTSGQGRARLLREAQAMARLSHPQVIGVFDVGTLGDQVFIAMEFVDGGTLTKWLAEAPRTQSEIIEKFTLAGRGLSAAHAAGLVHRDFKPDNVLVGHDGRVRVMDFGLAHSVGNGEERAEDSRPDASGERAAVSQSTGGALALRLTRTGALLGTPRYMSPEQYEGKKTDPRTDQFSFCVALYEALYHVPPFAGDTIPTLGYNVVHGRVLSPPPDARVPTWLRQVLLRGLSVAPEDRFPSMDELLTGLNRQGTGASRLWLAMIAVVFLTLLGNLGFHLYKERRDQPCRGSEKKLAGIWDGPSKAGLKQSLLATGKSYAADAWERVEAELDAYTQSWVKMRTSACMARVRGDEVGEVFELRNRCLEEHLQEVRAFTQLLSKADELTVEHAATAVHDLPQLSLCADIEALQAPQPLPTDPKERAEVVRLIEQLAEVRSLQRVGRFGEVIAKAMELAKRASELKYLPVRADALFLLGVVEDRGGMARQAEATFVQAAAAAIQSHNQRMVAQTWIRLTSLTGNRLNQPEKAESWEQLAIAALETLNQSDAEPLRAQLDVARCRVASAKHAYDLGIEYCQRALEQRGKLYGNSSSEVAEVLHTMASIYRRRENFDQAMRYYNEALVVEQKELGMLHPDIASEQRGIGILLRDQRRYREAQPRFDEALAIVQKSLGTDHIRTSDFHLLAGINLLYLNRLPEALKQLQRCFEIREKAGKAELERRAEARYFLSVALARLGRYEEALDKNLVGLELAEQDSNRKEARVAYNLHGIGAVMFAQRRFAESIPYLERALSIRQNLRDEERRMNLSRLAETQFVLAQALWNLGRGPARKRAVELARAAQANYTEWGNKPENELGAVSAWLTADTNKPPNDALAFSGGPMGTPGASPPPIAPPAPEAAPPAPAAAPAPAPAPAPATAPAPAPAAPAPSAPAP